MKDFPAPTSNVKTFSDQGYELLEHLKCTKGVCMFPFRSLTGQAFGQESEQLELCRLHS